MLRKRVIDRWQKVHKRSRSFRNIVFRCRDGSVWRFGVNASFRTPRDAVIRALNVHTSTHYDLERIYNIHTFVIKISELINKSTGTRDGKGQVCNANRIDGDVIFLYVQLERLSFGFFVLQTSTLRARGLDVLIVSVSFLRHRSPWRKPLGSFSFFDSSRPQTRLHCDGETHSRKQHRTREFGIWAEVRRRYMHAIVSNMIGKRMCCRSNRTSQTDLSVRKN